jgi:hypothetical protein
VLSTLIIVTFISIHSVIIYVVFFGACMRCTRLCPLKPGVLQKQKEIAEAVAQQTQPKQVMHTASYHSPYIPEYVGNCWGLVLKCYESRTRQHKMLNVNVLRPTKLYPLGINGPWTKVDDNTITKVKSP